MESTLSAQIPDYRDNTGRKKQLSVSRLFDSVDYQPHRPQRLLHTAMQTHRFRVACAGRRTGKSTAGGHELTIAAKRAQMTKGLSRTGKRHEYWIVGPEYSDAEKEFRVVYDDLSKLGAQFDRPGTYNDPIGGNMHISLFDGQFQIHAKSAKYPKTLVGEGLMGVILAEAAKLKPTIWTKFIRPTLADYAREGSWALLSSTPEGKNWFYDQWMRGDAANDPNWWSIRMPSWSNDQLFPGGREDPEIIDMSRDMSEEKFKQEIGAEFTEFVGRVFKRFNEEDHVSDFTYDPRWPLYIAEDSGYTNPSVALFLQVDVWGTVTVIGEYYQAQRTPEEFAEDVLEHPRLGPLARHATQLYADPADPGTATTLSQKWRVSKMGGTGGELKDRIDLIRRWLKPNPPELEDGHPDKKPRLFIDRSCTNLIREMNDYRYPETKGEQKNEVEVPMKKDDHAPEALGRFFAGYFGKQEKSKRSGARQSNATFSRGR